MHRLQVEMADRFRSALGVAAAFIGGKVVLPSWQDMRLNLEPGNGFDVSLARDMAFAESSRAFMGLLVYSMP